MRTIFAAAIFTLLLAAIGSPLAAQTTRPTFLFLLEGKGVPTGTIHVFSVNASTGAITEVLGSPFNAGLIPVQLAVDPTGRFVYVANQLSEDITAFSVDASTGTLTELPGSAFPIGSQPIALAIDPTGRFLYVSATNFTNGALQQSIYEYTIDSVTGVVTAAAGSPFLPGTFVTSIAFNPKGNFAYLSQGSPDPPLLIPILVCAVDFSSGQLTLAAAGQPAGQPAAGGADHATVSPSDKFLYSIDSNANAVDAFTIEFGSGSPTEISSSPYAVANFPDSLLVHPSGNFLYVVNLNQPYQPTETPSQYDGSISAFVINSGTGALTPVAGSPFAAGINPTSIVVDPTGQFAYSTSTKYTTGFTGFAQIMGFSIDASSGILKPFFGTPWTDSANSNGAQLAISSAPSITENPVPMISSLSPPSTTATAIAFTLQVHGANFVPGATVYFGGQPRNTVFVSSTQLNASILATDIDNGGTAVVFVFNPLPGGGASTSVEFPVSAPSPVISSISPSSVAAGAIPFALFVFGSGFVTSSVVNLNGTDQATAYVSPGFLFFEIFTAEILASGTLSITVTSPSNGVPGGGTSNTATLTIGPAIAPLAVSSISPTSATAGDPGFTLTVNGSGFVPGSQVTFNLNKVPTTFINSTQLTASIPASAIAIAGNPYVIVTNPDGFASVAVTFTVNNPQPVGGSVSAGSNALTLNVTGTGFVPSSIVLVNGSSRVTTYISSTLLQATLLPGDLSQSGTLNITVLNRPPGGGTSAAISFTFTFTDYSVTAPNSTTSITAGQTANFALTVSSSNGTFSNSVMFSASGIPTDANPSFAPSATITPGATPQIVTLSITTMPHMAGSAIEFPHWPHPVWPVFCVVGMILALAGLGLRAIGGRVQVFAPQLLLALLLVVAAGLVSCGATGYGPPSPPPLNPATGTPAGTYPIIVTATSGGVRHSATVTLKVM